MLCVGTGRGGGGQGDEHIRLWSERNKSFSREFQVGIYITLISLHNCSVDFAETSTLGFI